ncbi:MAG: helix-turn-helix domain-containing protein [Actinomycetota bacterium]|nr:helix-turn-helix domain-containing protein [Actinomycetota bacterium]
MSQPITEGIGQRIARYRKMNHWSARQLAEATDGALTRDTIANIESGRRTDITVRQFLAIALALRIPPTALLVDLEHPLTPSGIQFPGSAPAPLERTAPHITLAGWLNGQTPNDTSSAGRWVTHVTTLLTEYLAAADNAEAQDALDRIATARSRDDREQLTERLQDARAALLAAGVYLPLEGT